MLGPDAADQMAHSGIQNEDQSLELRWHWGDKTGHKQGNRDGDHDGMDAVERSRDAWFPVVDNGTCL